MNRADRIASATTTATHPGAPPQHLETSTVVVLERLEKQIIFRYKSTKWS